MVGWGVGVGIVYQPELLDVVTFTETVQLGDVLFPSSRDE